MPFRTLRLFAALAILPLIGASVTLASPSGQASPVATSDCAVTLPNRETPPGEEGDERWYGSGREDATLWLLMHWEDGAYTPAFAPGTQEIDEYPIKLAFWRGEGSGEIAVAVTEASGQRLPDDAFGQFQGDPIPGLHPLGGSVPGPGCWTFTATDGNDTIEFTVRVASPFGDCDVTGSNGEHPPGELKSRWYGSGAPDASLWVLLPGVPIAPLPDFDPVEQGGYSEKTLFWRGEGSGPIELTGERLDQPSDYEP